MTSLAPLEGFYIQIHLIFFVVEINGYDYDYFFDQKSSR